MEYCRNCTEILLNYELFNGEKIWNYLQKIEYLKKRQTVGDYDIV